MSYVLMERYLTSWLHSGVLKIWDCRFNFSDSASGPRSFLSKTPRENVSDSMELMDSRKLQVLTLSKLTFSRSILLRSFFSLV